MGNFLKLCSGLASELEAILTSKFDAISPEFDTTSTIEFAAIPFEFTTVGTFEFAAEFVAVPFKFDAEFDAVPEMCQLKIFQKYYQYNHRQYSHEDNS